jgi:hypothetical protein
MKKSASSPVVCPLTLSPKRPWPAQATVQRGFQGTWKITVAAMVVLINLLWVGRNHFHLRTDSIASTSASNGHELMRIELGTADQPNAFIVNATRIDSMSMGGSVQQLSAHGDVELVMGGSVSAHMQKQLMPGQMRSNAGLAGADVATEKALSPSASTPALLKPPVVLPLSESSCSQVERNSSSWHTFACIMCTRFNECTCMRAHVDSVPQPTLSCLGCACRRH